MADDDVTDELDVMGPIDYLVVEYPDGRLTGEALPYLVDLVDRGVIRVLDIAFVAKSSNDEVSVVTLAELEADAAEGVGPFQGASSGLLDDADLTDVGAVLRPGSLAGVLVYENTWAAPFGRALRQAGAQLVANGRIPVQGILAALEAAEAGPDAPRYRRSTSAFPNDRPHERTEPCQDFFEEWPGPPWSPVRRLLSPTASPVDRRAGGRSRSRRNRSPSTPPRPHHQLPPMRRRPRRPTTCRPGSNSSARWGRCATRAC